MHEKGFDCGAGSITSGSSSSEISSPYTISQQDIWTSREEEQRRLNLTVKSYVEPKDYKLFWEQLRRVVKRNRNDSLAADFIIEFMNDLEGVPDEKEGVKGC